MAEEQSTQRDFVLARLAAARAHSARISEGLESCIDFFLFPEEDEDGEGRKEILEALLDDIGGLTRSVDAAQTGCEGDFDFSEGEPDLPEGDEFDEEEEPEGEESEDAA